LPLLSLLQLVGRRGVALVDDPAVTAERLGSAAAEVDIVIDHLWGEPATIAIMALLKARTDRSRALDWVQIGATAGPTFELPSAALRWANLRLQGNGQGAVSPRSRIDIGNIEINAHPVPLAEVEAIWNVPEKPGLRTVLIP
jgi:hypothetical protein